MVIRIYLNILKIKDKVLKIKEKSQSIAKKLTSFSILLSCDLLLFIRREKADGVSSSLATSFLKI